MNEHQQIEWKESWRDEHLRWICGFANAQGGILQLGRNDTGVVIGLDDVRKLLEDIPNKVRDILGILVHVNLRKEDGREYLEVVVDPYPYPVNYKGRYFCRSGSTVQELKGAALDRFLLNRQGKRWDGVPVPEVSPEDLDAWALKRFRERAARSQRLSLDILQEDNRHLLDKLYLLEGTYLKRAALLLFHADPERFVTGAFVKIGYFESNSHLIYHDEVHGDLFSQVDKTLDLLLSKYLKVTIRYEGVQRIETYPIPEEALRESLLNAVSHKDYSSHTPIQISVYDDRILFWNNGQLQDGWTVEKLMVKHPSQPYNPDIANVFFRAGMIESWGRGIEKILDSCKQIGAPEPQFRFQESGLWVEFAYSPPAKSSVKSSVKIVEIIRNNSAVTVPEMAASLGISKRSVEKHIRKLKNEEIIRRVGPDKGGHWEIVK